MKKQRATSLLVLAVPAVFSSFSFSFLSLSLSLSLSLFLSSFSAQAASVRHDLIVRYRQPQGAHLQGMLAAMETAGGAASQMEVLNSSEGVLKLRFDSPQDADRARRKLELMGDVLSVSANHLYKPAIRYSFREVEPEYRAPAFLTAPFLSLQAMAELPEVELPPAQMTPGLDPLAASDWALASIRMPAAQPTGLRASIITAVIDTGIDYNHEDLLGAMWRKPGAPAEVGYDFAHDSAKPYDLVHFDVEGCMKNLTCALGIDQSQYLVNPGHGTHCAGHVGAVANNSLGMRGVGSGAAQVMGLKFFYDVGEENAGAGDDAAAIQSIDYAIQNGAKVISASWGGRIKRADADSSELKQALVRAQKAGVLVVIAAGNDGVDQDTIEDPAYPAAYDLDNLIVVAASDQADRLADFSSYGARSVHIAAPGVRILSTISTSPDRYSDLIAKYKDGSGRERQIAWDGTSMATPIVAGAAALVWARNPGASYREIRERILSTARPVEALAGKVSSGGVLDVTAALQ